MGRLEAFGKWLRSMLCITFDHPPVIQACFGYITCARCGEQLGDNLTGIYNGSGQMLVGHDCDECDKARASLRPIDRLLTEGV